LTKICYVNRDRLQNFYISLKGLLYELHQKYEWSVGHQIHQNLNHLTINVSFSLCLYAYPFCNDKNIFQSRRPFQS